MQDYRKNKKLGHATLVKSGDKVVLSEARFNAVGGAPEDPVTKSFTMDKINRNLARAETNAKEALSYVKDMKQFKLDAEALISEDK